MRVLLVAGKGGVGKTTVAAATALAAAGTGLRTLVVSTDPAHSLTDVLAVAGPSAGTGEWRAAGDPAPVPGAPGPLDVLQIDTRARMDEAWTAVRRAAGGLLAGAGVDPLVAEEIATVPGMEDVLALLDVARHAPSYDAVVVDCAPTAETLRLLALPEALDRLVRRGLPVEARIARLLGGAGLDARSVEALDALDDLAARLVAVRRLVTGPDAAVRLVTTPEKVVLAESIRSRTTLALLGHHVESVVVNRVAVGEGWPSALVDRHRAALLAARDAFAAVPVRHAPYRESEPIGVPALLEVADVVLADADPLDLGATRAHAGVSDDGAGWRLDLPVPGADASDLSVGVTEDGDLVVDLGPHRRVVPLPSLLHRCDVQGASVDLTDTGQVLRVRFAPDPGPVVGRGDRHRRDEPCGDDMTERRAGEEAARLLGAAQEWLRDSAPHLAPTDSDGTPCSCPLCRGVAAVREADPETVSRWVDGAVAALEDALVRLRPAPPSAADGPAGPGAAPEAEDAPDAAQGDAPVRRVRRVTVSDGDGSPDAQDDRPGG